MTSNRWVSRLVEIANKPFTDQESFNLYSLLKCSIRLHLAIRTHRDLHIQFVKTQIGLPPSESTQTASTSGAPNAMHAAHGMRHGAHGQRDPIVPIYEVILGKPFPAVQSFDAIFRDGVSGSTFVGRMLVNTAKVCSRAFWIFTKASASTPCRFESRHTL